MFSLFSSDLDVLKLSTTDWSRLESDDTPTLEQIITEYTTRFECEVSPAQYTLDGAPQLELKISVNDVDGTLDALKAMFRGDEIYPHAKVFRALVSRLDALQRAHMTANPVLHFSPATAAVFAFHRVRFSLTSKHRTKRLSGYRRLRLRELKNGRLNPVVSLGRLPKNKVIEGGHLFRFDFDDPNAKEPKRLAELVLVDAYGVHDTYLYEGRAPSISSFTGKVLYTPNRHQKLPAYFRSRPAESATPPVSHRLTYHAQLSEEQRIEFETALDHRIERNDTGSHIFHFDLSDVSNWPEMRDRLFAGKNIAQERESYNVIAARLRTLLSQPSGLIYLPTEAAALLALERIQNFDKEGGLQWIALRGICESRRQNGPQKRSEILIVAE